MANECQSKKKKRETRKCFKYDKEEHISKDCKKMQPMKKYKIQEELDNEDNKEKEQSFDNDLK